MNTADRIDRPWCHWLADDFLSVQCLRELKNIDIEHGQAVPGRRRDSVRTFVDHTHANVWPCLWQLWQDLDGPLRQWFSHYTGVDYAGMYVRLEVISDRGWFELAPHCDHAEKRLTAFVYTDHAELWPGTELTHGHRVQSRDNRCFFFVPGTDTTHSYPGTYFDRVRRCLQINYWTVSA